MRGLGEGEKGRGGDKETGKSGDKQGSSFCVHRSAFIIHHSSFIVLRSALNRSTALSVPGTIRRMDYQQALDYLYSFLDSEANLPRRPAEFNLPRTEALLRAAGEPQRAFPSVVIAGTKGKGSTAVMLEAIVRAAGLRTGLWTSPHLHSYRERIQVNRKPISQQELIDGLMRLRPVLDSFDSEQYGTPSVFDVGFALALQTFAGRSVDLAILEVGLGGRYDSANTITPVVSVITSISYDHMQILGNTLGEIAYQKAGIAKPGVPLVVAPQPTEALTVIENVAREVGAPLFPIVQPSPTPDLRLPTPALLGTFQRENALVAAGAARLLRKHFSITELAIEQGLQTATWPGRFEIVAGTPTWVLDGAHNGDSAERLIESVREQFARQRIVLLFGTTREKDVARMFAALLPAVDALVLTHSVHPRAETDLARLAEYAKTFVSGQNIQVAQAFEVPAAIACAQSLAQSNDVVLVTGSLFVVAAAREALGLPHEKD